MYVSGFPEKYQRVEVKVDGLGGKWTAKSGKSGRFNASKVDGKKKHKVDGLRKWSDQNTKQTTVCQKTVHFQSCLF